MAYYSTKTYGHQIGLSACFRQPNAHSHCKLLHGYSLGFKFTFACDQLDIRNWVVDFGGLKPLKAWLEETFDHKVVLDFTDQYMYKFEELENMGLIEIVKVDGVGVEKFAYHAHKYADKLVREMTDNRCWVSEVECAEHGANSAIYKA
jgi:6-pyruvoyltetrahydropterin/6-carboxytetrahydropterin synthase|tara:strand:+ start:125 stop:568 length:444 start_codon:yes stop_codon:yes gene_type:complete